MMYPWPTGSTRRPLAWAGVRPPRLGNSRCGRRACIGARQIVETWDRAHDGGGMDELLGHIVRQVRLWRPEVIVTPDAGREDDDPLVSLIHQAVREAIRRAADAEAFPGNLSRPA